MAWKAWPWRWKGCLPESRDVLDILSDQSKEQRKLTEIVDDYVDDLVLGENERVGVFAVDEWVDCVCACAHY